MQPVLSRRAFLAASSPLTACGGGRETAAAVPIAQTAQSELAVLIGAAPNGGAITLEPGKVYSTGGVDVTGKRLTLIAHGAVIQCQGAGLIKRDHGNKLTMLGGRFVGIGPAISLDMAPSFITSDDYRLDGVDFEVDADAAVRLVGAREGRLNACAFHGAGLYLRASVSPYVHQGIFIGQGKRTAVFYDGTGAGFDCGLVLSDCEVMGWDRGVDVRYTDWLRMTGTTVDFNEACNVELVSQDCASIEGCYLGSKNATPALRITAGPLATLPDYSANITVRSHFTGHTEAPGYDCIVVDGSPDGVILDGSHIDFYTRYGVRYTLAHGRMSIMNNKFAPRWGFGVLPIFNAGQGGDSNLLIADNAFPPGTDLSGAGIAFAKLRYK